MNKLLLFIAILSIIFANSLTVHYFTVKKVENSLNACLSENIMQPKHIEDRLCYGVMDCLEKQFNQQIHYGGFVKCVNRSNQDFLR